MERDRIIKWTRSQWLIPEVLENRFMETLFLRNYWMHRSVLVMSFYLCSAQSAIPGIFCIIDHMLRECLEGTLFICWEYLCGATEAYCMLSIWSQMAEFCIKTEKPQWLNPRGGTGTLSQSLFYFLTNAELISWCMFSKEKGAESYFLIKGWQESYNAHGVQG